MNISVANEGRPSQVPEAFIPVCLSNGDPSGNRDGQAFEAKYQKHHKGVIICENFR